MAENEQAFLTDGSQNFIGGQDASKRPWLIPEDTYAAGVNISIPNGIPQPRWGWKKKKVKPLEGGITIPIKNIFLSYEEIYRSCRYQGSLPYTIGSTHYILSVIGGIIFLWNQKTEELSVVPIQGGGHLNENTPRLHIAYAGRFLVIHDYPNFPVILDGITARRSNTYPYGMPVSRLGAYSQNRYFIANGGKEFTAGDPVGNVATPDAPITYEEVLAPAASFLNQLFELPTDRIEPITAMGFLQLTDGSTEVGPLLVASSTLIQSYQTQRERQTWTAGTFGTAFVINSGIAGPRAWDNVGSDIFFLSGDGQLRTAAMSREEQKKWSRVPISREVENWLAVHDLSLLEFSLVRYFKNRIFVSANPFRVTAQSTDRTPVYDIAHGGFVVLSTDNLATLGHDGKPAWEGLWTGLRPMDFIVDEITGRAFVFSKDEASRNELYEIDANSTFDEADGYIRYPPAILYTRQHNFKSEFQNKNIHSIDLMPAQVQGDFEIKVDYKPSHASSYKHWGTFNHCAPWRQCGQLSPIAVNGLAPHNFKNITIGSPQESCSAEEQAYYTNFRALQLRLQISGKNWELEGYRVKALATPQNELQSTEFCGPQPCLEIPLQCTNINWQPGEFSICLTQQT